jgi:hypothetical protein
VVNGRKELAAEPAACQRHDHDTHDRDERGFKHHLWIAEMDADQDETRAHADAQALLEAVEGAGAGQTCADKRGQGADFPSDELRLQM